MKRIIALTLAILTLTGCSSLLEGSQDYSMPHGSSTTEDSNNSMPEIDVSTYDELRDALLTFVSAHIDGGTIRFNSYVGNMEQDLNNACIYVTNDTALGSYAVSYIRGSLNRIVGYYEATISIIYKKEAVEISSIEEVESLNELEAFIENMMDTCSEPKAISTSNLSIKTDTINDVMTKLYYSKPELIISLPELSITEYSDITSAKRIYEVQMDYSAPASVMLGKRSAFDTILDQLPYQISETYGDKAKLLYQLCKYLSDNVDYIGTVPDEEYSRSDSANTAYGALYVRKASGEGLALAMQLLCNWGDIECQVVTGRYNNYMHAWNMIKIDGDWYHFDISRMSDGASSALLRTDKQMATHYSWDTNKYPACSGRLNYTYLTGTAPTDQPAQAANPANTQAAEPEDSNIQGE